MNRNRSLQLGDRRQLGEEELRRTTSTTVKERQRSEIREHHGYEMYGGGEEMKEGKSLKARR